MFLYSRAGSSYRYKKKGMICIKTKPLVWRIAITIAVAAFLAAAFICLRPYRYCAANLPPFAAYREFYRGMPMEDCRAALFAENDGTRVCWEQDGALYHVYAAGSYLVFFADQAERLRTFAAFSATGQLLYAYGMRPIQFSMEELPKTWSEVKHRYGGFHGYRGNARQIPVYVTTDGKLIEFIGFSATEQSGELQAISRIDLCSSEGNAIELRELLYAMDYSDSSKQGILDLRAETCDYLLEIQECGIACRVAGSEMALIGTSANGVYFDGNSAVQYQEGETSDMTGFSMDGWENLLQTTVQTVQTAIQNGYYRDIGCGYAGLYYEISLEGLRPFSAWSPRRCLLSCFYHGKEFAGFSLRLYAEDAEQAVFQCRAGTLERVLADAIFEQYPFFSNRK